MNGNQTHSSEGVWRRHVLSRPANQGSFRRPSCVGAGVLSYRIADIARDDVCGTRPGRAVIIVVNMSQLDDFQEIAHSGGQLIIRIGADDRGRRGYQLTWQHERPVPAAVFAVYALPQGIVVGQMNLGGIGSIPNPPPVPGCFQVFIGSDSEGKFGHQCPVCNGYWRAGADVQFCPYCGMRGELRNFLTRAQKSYVEQVCARMGAVLAADEDGEHVIDMDAVADAAGKQTKKLPFYYAEESQQNKFTCKACGAFNDILGTFGYCSSCGTRNDFQELSEKTIPRLRERINTGGPYEACVRDSVAAFDSFVGQHVTQLVHHVPMTRKRRSQLESRRFHNLQSVACELNEMFDIDILHGLTPDEVRFATLMFHRRHVYEHKGGEADESTLLTAATTPFAQSRHCARRSSLHTGSPASF